MQTDWLQYTSLQQPLWSYNMQFFWQLDPSHATLDWLLDVITERIDADPEAVYLIDFIPNLKYMLRAKFLQENITEALERFEEKVRKNIASYNLVSAVGQYLYMYGTHFWGAVKHEKDECLSLQDQKWGG